MPYSEQQWSRNRVETLMDIATTLADYTQSMEQCSRIPSYLSRILDLEPITLAVVRQNKGGEAMIALIGSSGQVATGEAAANFKRHILELHQQTRPLTTSDALALRESISVGPSEAGFAEMAMQDLVTYPKALVVARTVDDNHRLLLVVHQRAEEAPLSAAIADTLLMIASQLGKLLKCMVSWHDRPEILGGPFNRLTDREWVVLRGLNSDDGEKQLADRLSLSPHTLHSHIKSIYRKVGVQGRLPLLLRLNEALRDLRTVTINTRPSAISSGTILTERTTTSAPERAAAFA